MAFITFAIMSVMKIASSLLLLTPACNEQDLVNQFCPFH